jgi:hypothetical protein
MELNVHLRATAGALLICRTIVTWLGALPTSLSVVHISHVQSGAPLVKQLRSGAPGEQRATTKFNQVSTHPYT